MFPVRNQGDRRRLVRLSFAPYGASRHAEQCTIRTWTIAALLIFHHSCDYRVKSAGRLTRPCQSVGVPSGRYANVLRLTPRLQKMDEATGKPAPGETAQ